MKQEDVCLPRAMHAGSPLGPHLSKLWASCCSQFQRLNSNAQLGGLTLQQAAVAADLVLTWRRELHDPLRGKVSQDCAFDGL